MLSTIRQGQSITGLLGFGKLMNIMDTGQLFLLVRIDTLLPDIVKRELLNMVGNEQKRPYYSDNSKNRQ